MSGVGRIVFSPPFLFLPPAVGSWTCWRWAVLACSRGCRHWAESHQNSGSGHAPGDCGPSRLPLPRSRAVGQPLLGRKCFGRPSDSCTLPSRAPGVVSVSGGRTCYFPGGRSVLTGHFFLQQMPLLPAGIAVTRCTQFCRPANRPLHRGELKTQAWVVTAP